MSRPSTRAESDYYVKYPKREKSYERVRPQPQQDPTVVQYEKGHVTIVNNHSHFPGHSYGADQQDFTTERGPGNYNDELDAPLHPELEGERYNDDQRRDRTNFDERSSGLPPDDDEPRGRQEERVEYRDRNRQARSLPRGGGERRPYSRYLS
ncbi:hypothetical protein B0A52_01816 [Exophiala mesophila]|uniref:Uncharacterized protein n=1 Tax=Exophiala mesophila TaxID=212818 RepID=A0A438NG30_EXOME|nr:hypothetical protein B0A52_01816 [Exophiala mesophila]